MINSKDCWLKPTCKKYNNKEKDCECRVQDVFCIKLFKLNELYDQSLLSLDQRKRKNLFLDSNGYDKEEFIFLKNFCENIEENVTNGVNLYIYSDITGNGKTAWSEKILQSYLESIWHKSDLSCKALFISVPRFLISIKDNISHVNEYYSHIKQNVIDADIVVWDDIATKDMTQFEHDNLLSIIDTRLSLGKSNVFTTNIRPDNLQSYLGPRLSSRIINYSKCIEFKGSDKRGYIK